MKRKLEQYRNCTPDAVASGSKAQMMYFVEDAKRDISELATSVVRLREALKDLLELTADPDDTADPCESTFANARKVLADTEL